MKLKPTPYLVFFILFLFILSCRPLTIEKDGGLMMDIEFINLNSSDSDIDKTIQILANRVRVNYKNPEILLNKDNRSIEIKLPKTSDTATFKEYLLVKGNLRIQETFDASEIFPALGIIDGMIVNNNGYDFPFSKKDSVSPANLSLLALITPATDRYGSMIKGANLGFVQSKDTALVKSILKSERFSTILPRYFNCLWTRKQGEDYYGLIAIRMLPHSNMITSQDILSANASKDENTGTDIINVNLKPEGSQRFAQMTRENLMKALSIVIDDIVYSSPIVSGEITGGKFVISGGLSETEAKALSATLNYGVLPIDVKINKVVHVKPK